MILGRRYLLAALQRVSAREVALRTHCSRSAVHKWSAGERAPSPPARAALELHLRIPADAWEVSKVKRG